MASLGTTLPPKDYVPILRKNVAMSRPVIAAVNGAALAGGFMMVQTCDLVIAARHATFGITEARRGRGFPWAVPLTRQLPPPSPDGDAGHGRADLR